MKNQEATEKYIALKLQIADEVKKLQSGLDKQTPPKINWGHVGDMNHILSHLKQLTESEE